MIRLHAILSLSGAHIWTKCAPSARFQEQIPEENTLFAQEGTIAHDIAACLLLGWTNQISQEDMLEQFQKHTTYARNWYEVNKPEENADDMVSEMIMHAEAFATLVYQIGGRILVEQRLDLARFIPLSWGTGDGINLFPDIIYISDLKYGKGKRVYVEDNSQLMGYGLGAYLKAVELGYDPHTVVMTIYQPRVNPEPSTVQMSVTELLDWAANVVAPMAELAIAGQGEFVAGEHCQFCKARTSCAAFYNMFADVWNIRDARVITDEQRAFVLENAGVLTSWLKVMKDDAVKVLRNRGRIPGFKLVATTGDRKIINEAAVVNGLKDMGYQDADIYVTQKLKPITTLESMFKPKKLFQEKFAEYIIKPEGNPKLVKEDHAAPAICETAADAFNAPDYTQLDDEYQQEIARMSDDWHRSGRGFI